MKENGETKTEINLDGDNISLGTLEAAMDAALPGGEHESGGGA